MPLPPSGFCLDIRSSATFSFTSTASQETVPSVARPCSRKRFGTPAMCRSAGPQNKALHQTKRRVEDLDDRPGVINVRFAGERCCCADLVR